MKLSPTTGETPARQQFAYMSGDQLVVDGAGTLQVYDMLGRELGHKAVNGTTVLDLRSLGMRNSGAYELRLGEKTQKIVIKY